MGGSILIIGLGNLGKRIAAGLAGCVEVDELLLAGRDARDGPPFAALLAACGAARVRFEELDAGRPSSVESLLRRERPDVVVQCASLLSPWHLASHPGPVSDALGSAGFAAQLPAQLPLILNVMRSAREVDFRGAVVNCSFPDLTHPVLAGLGLAPTIGTGNVSMIRARVCAVLRERGAGRPPEARVLAHHAHLTPVMLSAPPAEGQTRPRVYLGAEGERADELAFAGPPLRSDPGLNALSAASALPVIRALLPGAAPLSTSAPGPLGLPGGYPVRIADGQVQLDLPGALSLEEALEFQRQSARLDGVETIAGDGTVFFTEAAREILRGLHPALAEPLPPSEALNRFSLLRSVLVPDGE
ncbi:MAG TPA: hypothetical protein VF668_23360 [Pyrinomonadaceae bacterium]|jgi:hypothetical protein